MKTKKPTDAQCAGNCGLSEEAYLKIKHIRLDEMVAFAALFGTHLRISISPKEPAKKLATSKVKNSK